MGLGLIGVVLPILPTVPFMLLAAFFFSKSSERLHYWLISHPKLGPPIVEWQTNGAINPRVKKNRNDLYCCGFPAVGRA